MNDAHYQVASLCWEICHMRTIKTVDTLNVGRSDVLSITYNVHPIYTTETDSEMSEFDICCKHMLCQ